jgi:hypothetical protein
MNIELVRQIDVAEVMEYYTTMILNSIESYILTIISKYPKQRIKMYPFGGIARSTYLIEQIKSLLDNYNVQIIVNEPSFTIIRGATTLGLNQQLIRDRVYQYSYGTQFSKPYDPKVDDPQAHRWGTPPNEYIAAFLPFTSPGEVITEDQVFEQLVCPANDEQTAFPFGLYYSLGSATLISRCFELTTIVVGIPPAYQNLGKENRFKILMNFRLTEIKFTVIHMQSGEIHETLVYF